MNPAKAVKYSLIVLAVVLLLLAASMAAFVYFFPKDTLKSLIEQTLRESLNRPVRIASIDYSLRGISMSNLYIYDTDETKPFIAHSKEAAIRFQLWPLLQRQFIINYIYLNDAVINIIYHTKDKKTDSNIAVLIKELLAKERAGITTEIKSISLQNAAVILKNPPKELKPLEGRYLISTLLDINEKNIELSNLSIIMPHNRGRISGTCTIGIKGDFFIEADVRLHSCDLLWVYGWSPHNLAAILPYRTITGTVSNLLITKHRVQGTVTGSCKLSNNTTIHITNGFCNVDIDKQKVTIANVKGKIENSSFVVQQLLLGFKGEILAIKIPNADVVLKEIAPLLGAVDVSDISADIEGSASYANKKINAEITLSKVQAGLKDKILSIDDEVDVIIRDNQFRKEAIPAKVYSVPSVLSIATMDDSFKKFAINAEIDELNLATVLAGASQSKKEFDMPVELSGRIVVRRLLKDTLVVENINCSYTMHKNVISFPSFTAKIFGGDITGRTVVTLSPENPTINVVAKFTNVRLQNVSSYLEFYENRIFGNVSGQFQGTIVPKKPVFDRITGRAEFTVANGKLANTGLQDGLSIWLADLKYKLSNLEFQKIYGNVSLNGPAITINSFVFNAPDIRLKLDGIFNRHDVSDIGIILEFSSHFIQDLPNPALIQLARYRKGRWYVIPFEAKGKDIFDGKSIRQVQ